MNDVDFDPIKYYDSYPTKVIGRPGYPARAAFKSALLWKLYGERLLAELKQINSYADIGGCFGFGANAMAFHIFQRQGVRPRTAVYEISPGFVEIGKALFPEIEFIQRNFAAETGSAEIHDLVTLVDVVEHIVGPDAFLQSVATRARYVMLKTPMETTGDWRGNKPPALKGEEHPDGHVNFFSPAAYEKLLRTNGLDIIDSDLLSSIIPVQAEMALIPESPQPSFRQLVGSPKRLVAMALRKLPGVSWQLKRKILSGGEHLCLCRSRLVPR